MKTFFIIVGFPIRLAFILLLYSMSLPFWIFYKLLNPQEKNQPYFDKGDKRLWGWVFGINSFFP